MSDVFNWQLPPAPGFPGYQPRPQAPPQGQPSQQNYQRLSPAPPKPIGPIDADSHPSADADAEPYEPFIPSRDDRPYNQWGTDDFAMAGARNQPGIAYGPLMPQMRDLAGLIHGAVMGLGRFGSHYTGMPAIAMGTYASAYWSAYQKGMHERAAQSYQQYRMARQMTIDRGKEEMQEYAGIYGAYHEGGKITDPNAFSHELLIAAKKYQNHRLIAAIEGGRLDEADRILGATDSHIMNLIKAQHQEEQQKQIQRLRDAEIQRIEDARKREEERRKAIERERQKYDPSATGPGSSYVPESVPPASIPAPESEAVPDTPESDESAGADENDIPPDTASNEPTPPDEPQRSVQVADASGQVPIGGDISQAEPSKAVGFGPEGKPETDAIERAAKDYVFTRKLPPGVEKNIPDIAGRMTTRAGQLEDWLDNMESDPKIKPNSIIHSVRKVFPKIADKIEGYLAGKLTPTGVTGTQAKAEWDRAITLAHRINPDFSQGTFKSIQEALVKWTRGAGGQNLTSLGTAMDHAETLLSHLSSKPWPYTAEIARRFGGPNTMRLDADISTFAEEYVRAMSGKGPTLPELKEEKEKLNLNYPESSLRALVEERINLLHTKILEKQNEFASDTGFPATDIMKRFKSFTETDPTATNRDRSAVKGLEDLFNWKPGNQNAAPAPTNKDKVINYKDYFK